MKLQPRDIPVDFHLFSKTWGKVGPVNERGCMEWTAATNRQGYGYVARKRRGVFNGYPAHRVVFKMFNPNEDMTNLVVMHTCDNPLCCNPDHLRLGTHQDNSDDCVAKNRQTKGRDVPTNVLTEEQVHEIRHLYDTKKLNVSELSRKFGVSRRMIDFIGQRINWKHLEEREYEVQD